MVYAAAAFITLHRPRLAITWRPSRATDVAAYEIWAANKSGGPYYRLAVIDDPASYRYSQETETGSLYLAMTAVDRRGNRSLYSNEAAVNVI